MSDTSHDSPDRLRLLLSKLSVLIILVGLVYVGRRHGAFPIVNWPMYSSRPMPFPAGSVSAFEIRVRTQDGGAVKLSPASLLPFGRDQVILDLIGAAFSSEDAELRARYQLALGEMVRRSLRDRGVAGIEVWRVVWKVEPLASPPLDRLAPADQILLGRIDLQGAPAVSVR